MNPPSQEDANADAARLVADALAAGCDQQQRRVVYMSPGSRSTPLVIAFEAHPHIELRVVLDERAAAFAALGAAAASGRAVATLCTSGSAAAHALPAVIEAHHAGVPVIVLTADRPLESQGIGAPQTTTQTQLYAAHTKAHYALPAPLAENSSARRHVEGQWRLLVAQALRTAQTSCVGPVHLNLPFRDPLGTTPSSRDDLPPPVRFGAIRPAHVCEQALRAALEHLKDKQRVAVVVGPRVPSMLQHASFTTSLGALSAKLHWPVFVESTSNLPWPRWAQSPQTTGGTVIYSGDAWGLAATLHPSLRPDAWIHIGLPPAGRGLLKLTSDPQAAHVTLHPEGMSIDAAHVGDVFLTGEPSLWLHAWQRMADGPSDAQTAFARRCEARQEAMLSVLRANDKRDDAWFEGQTLRMVVQAAPAQTCFVWGNSLTVRDVDTFAAFDAAMARDATVAHRRGVSGIDGALAHAAGVQATLSNQPLVCCFGDLTFLYDVASLRLLVEQQRPAKIFVFDNGGGEIFSQLPALCQAPAFDALFRTPQAVDAAGLCRAQGAVFQTCKSKQELQEYLSRSGQRTNGVEVIWLSFDANARAVRQQWMQQLGAVAAAPVP